MGDPGVGLAGWDGGVGGSTGTSPLKSTKESQKLGGGTFLLRGRPLRRCRLGACHPGHNAANYCQQRTYEHNFRLYIPHNISHLAYH